MKRLVAYALVVSAWICGGALWLYSLLTVYQTWGTLAALGGVFFAIVGIVPLAALAIALHGTWQIFWFLIVSVATTFGIWITGASIIYSLDNPRQSLHPDAPSSPADEMEKIRHTKASQ